MVCLWTCCGPTVGGSSGAWQDCTEWPRERRVGTPDQRVDGCRPRPATGGDCGPQRGGDFAAPDRRACWRIARNGQPLVSAVSRQPSGRIGGRHRPRAQALRATRGGARVLDKAVTPPATLGRWSCRTMARMAGVSKATVQRLWAANDIKPLLTRTFKLSKDKQFEKKFWDVIGLYLNPPEKALILCCDEKSQCQALERTQPGLPLGVGHIKTKTHDYFRHGTLTLFAALNYLDGKLITRIAKRHRHQEWLAFLKTIDHQTPSTLDIHLIADNYATHKHAEVNRWLAKHPRFHMHFTPTSSSWLNLVERFFRDLTDFITAQSFASVGKLSDAIIAFLAEPNKNAKRYVWHAKGEDILRKIKAARQAMVRNEASAC